MSKLLEDLEKLASAEFVDLSVADAARDTIIRQQEEIAALRAQLEDRFISMRVRQLEHALDAERQTVRRLRAMLPPTAHSGVRNGPGEGSWSVFAEKVAEERDAARAEAEKLRAEVEQLSAVDAMLKQYFPQTHEGILAEIALMRPEGKP